MLRSQSLMPAIILDVMGSQAYVSCECVCVRVDDTIFLCLVLNISNCLVVWTIHFPKELMNNSKAIIFLSTAGPAYR